jgi:Flp pilus assembly protein CpaB
MPTYRIRNLVTAIGLAALATALTALYVTSYKGHVNRGEQLVRVLVASKQIAAGTAGAKAAGYVKTQTVLRRTLAEGAVGNLAAIRGLVAPQTIYPGQQITTEAFVAPSAQGPRGGLSGNVRLMAVPGDADQLLAGVLKAGDHVDVIAALKGNGLGSGNSSQILLRDLRVVTPADKPKSGGLGGGNNNTSVVLALTDLQAQELFYAMRNGDWALALRPSVGAAQTSSAPTTAKTLGR